MSENILLGKSRKSGKWEILVDPSETYDRHLAFYHKVAINLPVNDDYSRILFGRIQNTSTPLTLITTEEKLARDKAIKEVVDRASGAGSAADERQAKMEADKVAAAKEVQEKIIDEKNTMINEIRSGTGQGSFSRIPEKITQEREQAETDRQVRVGKKK